MRDTFSTSRFDLTTAIAIYIINILWIWNNYQILHDNLNQTNLYVFMYPNWVLIFNGLIGVAGLIIGTLLLTNKLNYKNAVILDLIILIIGLDLRETIIQF